jgi:Zn-dependent metalloprotease
LAILCHVVPPHILRSIAENGDEADRLRALAALEISSTPRRERQAVAILAGPPVLSRRGKRRVVFDAQSTQELPGRRVRADGGRPSRDVAVNEAWDGAGRTWDYFRHVHHRRSIDDRGMRIESTVHFGDAFNNAQWNGRQMIYGDGDGKYFQRFTASLEVIAHELTHGVSQYSAGLGWTGQVGALAEHFSDVFGVLTKQYSQKQKAGRASWIVGEKLFTRRVQGDGIRSMKAPGTAYDDPILGRDPQPAHIRDYVRTQGDDRGVHINCGIPNHAFYRVATLLGGYAWDVAGRIWYRALTRELISRSRFQHCADATARAAAELYGAKSEPREAVITAWQAVGIEVSELALEPAPTLFEPAAELPDFA